MLFDRSSLEIESDQRQSIEEINRTGKDQADDRVFSSIEQRKKERQTDGDAQNTDQGQQRASLANREDSNSSFRSTRKQSPRKTKSLSFVLCRNSSTDD